MSIIKIAILDDHKLFREGIASILAKYEDFEVAGEVENEEQLNTLLSTSPVNVLLIDISLPDSNGLEIVKKLKNSHPQIRTIVLTMHEEGQYVVKAVRNGAHGYLLKNTDEKELKEAIITVFEGKKYYNKDISALMIGNMSLEGDETRKLSARENEILQLVAKGLTTKEIADKLCVSSRTVETHRFNMMKKLQVQNSAELITKAINLGLI
jgi:DNA-binding NarL/FixJ family response regulator